ncbi:MAG: phosphatase PAP2 family protein [Bacteroidota bacterium]
MTGFLKNNFLVFALYALALVYASLLLLNHEKIFLHIYLNQFVGSQVLNVFFYYVTYLGDGMVAPFLLLIILIYNVRLGIYSTISFLSATLSAQVLKRCFFDDLNRPSYIFNYMFPYPIKYVDGVERYIHNSFPSGHATQAFSILMCLAFITKNQSLKLIFFFLALLTSMSRVYLSQHWLSDITAGSIIGFFFSILFYYVIIEKNKFGRLNKPLRAFKRS